MTLNFDTFSMSAKIELSDYNNQRVAYSPEFAATDFATLQTDVETTANLLSAVTGLHFEQISLRKIYTKLHHPAMPLTASVERIGLIVAELISPTDDYNIIEIPDPIDSIVLPDQTINLLNPAVISYANIIRLNAYGTNNRLFAESGGNTLLLASRRVPSLKAIKSEKAIG